MQSVISIIKLQISGNVFKLRKQKEFFRRSSVAKSLQVKGADTYCKNYFCFK
jgi:hypothetical protein